MKLYHGSNIVIETIDLSKSRVGKDFGHGFYLTPDRTIAENQARRRTDIEGGTPVVNEYDFDESVLTDYNVRTFDGYSIPWAEFVRMNRNNRTRQQAHDFDIIIGPIANDDIGMQMRQLTAGRITIQEFMKAIEWKTVTIQYFFCTDRSIKHLRKL